MGTAERICSRKNGYITVLRKLGADAAYRRETGETVLDGEKLLREAAAAGCEITGLLMDEARPLAEIPECGRLYVAPAELVGYASPVKNSPGPVFSLKLPELPVPEHPRHAVLLEDVPGPGQRGHGDKDGERPGHRPRGAGGQLCGQKLAPLCAGYDGSSVQAVRRGDESCAAARGFWRRSGFSSWARR